MFAVLLRAGGELLHLRQAIASLCGGGSGRAPVLCGSCFVMAERGFSLFSGMCQSCCSWPCAEGLPVSVRPGTGLLPPEWGSLEKAACLYLP